MSKLLVAVFFLLLISTVITYGVLVGGPYLQTRRDQAQALRNKTKDISVVRAAYDREFQLKYHYLVRLNKKVVAIDKAGYKGEERKRRIAIETQAAKAERKRVRASNFTSPYRME